MGSIDETMSFDDWYKTLISDEMNLDNLRSSQDKIWISYVSELRKGHYKDINKLSEKVAFYKDKAENLSRLLDCCEEKHSEYVELLKVTLDALQTCHVTLKAFLPDAFATISLVNSAINKVKEKEHF